MFNYLQLYLFTHIQHVGISDYKQYDSNIGGDETSLTVNNTRHDRKVKGQKCVTDNVMVHY